MGYKIAQICLNGHIITGNVGGWRGESEKFCSNCGEKTIESCQECGGRIKGDYEAEWGYIAIDSAPYYCINCGRPYPWTATILDNAVELVAFDDNLSLEQKELIKTTFPDLIVETPTTPVAIAKYKKAIKDAQEPIRDGLKQLFAKVVTETVKKSLWG
ncbi:DUF2321 domain-containing protein [Virgibacillus halodenitrificans]|uniref:DUF2321 domain-containing protein n=1 Tax=Virgibacillus halodenitrificans TaxID=1482 RepID=UPI001FB33F37|nr:DUF2321 domain-containing protein [Virgibacillus halodenitrificans]MCJ0932626.1 DUF2321 domain-containing protein [Virgibacillus halodenitrificans]